jgi:hypothetical protein
MLVVLCRLSITGLVNDYNSLDCKGIPQATGSEQGWAVMCTTRK